MGGQGQGVADIINQSAVMKHTVFKLLFLIAVILASYFCMVSFLHAQNGIFKVDIRHRPPEMMVDGNNFSGPLLDIIQEASKKIGYEVEFRKRHFKASLTALQGGGTDILPRTFWTKEREEVIDYLGPIGYQEKPVIFLVRPGKENLITEFEDLEKLTVAMKRGAYYFEQFNKNRKIRKLELKDDDNMVRMFRAGRFDTMIVNDKKALESALKKHNITECSFAKYIFDRKIGNYYGIAPNHPARERLQKAIEEMIKTGRIDEIYSKYDVTPPLHY